MKKAGVISRAPRAHVITHRGCEQNKQSEPRLDQFRVVGSKAIGRATASRCCNIGLGNSLDNSRLHTIAAPFTSNPGAVDFLRPRSCKARQQIAEMLTPKHSMIAPTATCAVAMSAALLLQITQAPRVSWIRRRMSHHIDKRFKQ